MNLLERQRLLNDHRHLDEEIQRVMKSPRTDPMILQRLKKQKLAIKDRLHQIVPPQNGMENAA